MLAEIEFTQFVPNDGRKKVMIPRGIAIADKAKAIKDAGYELECSHLDNGVVVVAIADPGADQIIASRILENGSSVPLAVDAMIDEFHTWLVSPKQFTAGFEPKDIPE